MNFFCEIGSCLNVVILMKCIFAIIFELIFFHSLWIIIFNLSFFLPNHSFIHNHTVQIIILKFIHSLYILLHQQQVPEYQRHEWHCYRLRISFWVRHVFRGISWLRRWHRLWPISVLIEEGRTRWKQIPPYEKSMESMWGMKVIRSISPKKGLAVISLSSREEAASYANVTKSTVNFLKNHEKSKRIIFDNALNLNKSKI